MKTVSQIAYIACFLALVGNAYEISAEEVTDDLATVQEQLLQSAAKTLPSVVGLRVNRTAVASGVVVSADGLVLTAGHVTSDAGLDVEFLFPDGKLARGKTLGVCKWADAAMARITDPGPWPFSPMAEKGDFAVDDWVFAFGHPLGLIVNRPPPLRIGRIIQLQPDTIHTDCCIVVGDSGGPLFNLAGKVVGINSRISGMDSRPDLTFHVSINAFWDQYDRMLAGEVWETDATGRYHESFSKQLLASVREIMPMTVRICSETTQNRPARGNNQRRRQQQQVQQRPVTTTTDLALGLIVTSDGLIATKASEVADRPNIVCVVITNGREDRYPATVVAVDSANDIALLKIEKTGLHAIDWESHEPPTQPIPIGTFVVTPVPNGQIPAILGAVSIGERSIPSENLMIGVSIDSSESWKGARVMQTLPRSPAASVGLRQNDLITKVNDTPIDSGPTFTRFLDKIKVGDELKLVVQRGREILSMTLKAVESLDMAQRRTATTMNQGGPFGISRVREGFSCVMQHDTVLRPADCGGPIVTLDGKLIGVNIARAGRTETYALPVARFRQIIDTLIQRPEVRDVHAIVPDERVELLNRAS